MEMNIHHNIFILLLLVSRKKARNITIATVMSSQFDENVTKVFSSYLVTTSDVIHITTKLPSLSSSPLPNQSISLNETSAILASFPILLTSSASRTTIKPTTEISRTESRRASLIVAAGILPGIILLFVICLVIPKWFAIRQKKKEVERLQKMSSTHALKTVIENVNVFNGGKG